MRRGRILSGFCPFNPKSGCWLVDYAWNANQLVVQQLRCVLAANTGQVAQPFPAVISVILIFNNEKASQKP